MHADLNPVSFACSQLQNYDPERALTDYINRLEALQRRLGSVQSGEGLGSPPRGWLLGSTSHGSKLESMCWFYERHSKYLILSIFSLKQVGSPSCRKKLIKKKIAEFFEG